MPCIVLKNCFARIEVLNECSTVDSSDSAQFLPQAALLLRHKCLEFKHRWAANLMQTLTNMIVKSKCGTLGVPLSDSWVSLSEIWLMHPERYGFNIMLADIVGKFYI